MEISTEGFPGLMVLQSRVGCVEVVSVSLVYANAAKIPRYVLPPTQDKKYGNVKRLDGSLRMNWYIGFGFKDAIVCGRQTAETW